MTSSGVRKKLPRLLVLGDAVVPTGFARVIHEIIAPMVGEFDIHQMGVNYIGQGHNWPWAVYPAMDAGIGFGFKRLRKLLDELRPDLIFMLSDDVILARWMSILSRWGGRQQAKVFIYCPVDNGPVSPSVLESLVLADHLFTFTRFGRRCLEEAMQKASMGSPVNIGVMPHGVDTQKFSPLRGDIHYHLSEEGRLVAKRRLVGDDPDLDGSFIVLNANRNQERKRIDTTIRGFARFAAGKPDSVKLYLHCGVKDLGWNVIEMAQREGIFDRLILSTVGGVKPAFSDEQMNKVYGACEVGINTSSAEGWGLTSFEHAATGAVQLAPGHTGPQELWQGHGELLMPSASITDMETLKDHYLIPDTAVADALERLYQDKEHWLARCHASYENAHQPHYGWGAISQTWQQHFHAALALPGKVAREANAVQEATPVTEDAKPVRYFKQYGARRSGSNYLRALLETNFSNVIVLMHILGDKHGAPVDLKKYHHRAHTEPLRFLEAATSENPAENSLPFTRDKRDFMREHAEAISEAVLDQRLVFLISIKDPYAWVASMMKVTAFKPGLSAQELEAALQTSVSAHCHEYNSLYRAYWDFHRQQPTRVCIVRHQELVSDPEGFLRSMAEAFQLEPVAPQYSDVRATALPTDWDHIRSAERLGEMPFAKESQMKSGNAAGLPTHIKVMVDACIDWSVAALYGYGKSQ